MKEKILPFIKKYPMSILLAIIAINLFSIAGTLKKNGQLDIHKQICLRRRVFYSGLPMYTDKQAKAIDRSSARKIGVGINDLYKLDEYCRVIIKY